MARQHARVISAEGLRNAIRTRRASYRTVARWAGCSAQMISLLATGKLATCSERLAGRIEHALNVAEGTLFLRTMSNIKFDNMSLDQEVTPCL